LYNYHEADIESSRFSSIFKSNTKSLSVSVGPVKPNTKTYSDKGN